MGLLAGAFAVVSALVTVPAGVLTDRNRRTLILAVSVGLWAVAMATSGLAVSFVMLLFTRLMFGVVSATAGPTLLSLSGDLFPRKGRGEALGLIRTGDMIGTGLSFMVLGVLVGTIGWRGCFFVMAIPAAVLAFALLRLPEPARTGGEPEAMSHVESARQNLGLGEVARKVLAIRTFRVVLISAFVGDFFFAGISVFLFVFLTHQYHVSRAAIVGLLPLVGVAGCQECREDDGERPQREHFRHEGQVGSNAWWGWHVMRVRLCGAVGPPAPQRGRLSWCKRPRRQNSARTALSPGAQSPMAGSPSSGRLA
ncbi:MAG: MFS transporter [Acidimicrobiales bacterium]